MSSVRVLYLQRALEAAPPDNLLAAAEQVHVIPAGSSPDQAARDFVPTVALIREPFDFEARGALERVLPLNIPCLGLGRGACEHVLAVLSTEIRALDLAAVLEMTLQLHACENPLPDSYATDDGGERATEDTIHVLERLMSLRIPGYKERAMRIFDTCLWIGNHLCLSAQDLKELLHAARVREIGKLGLPDKLLFSQRKHRTPEDQLLYDQYCDHGMAALSEFKQLRGAARLIGQMLENFDGSSRDGRMAHQIPLGSRILRVAAAFEMIMVDHQFKLSTAQVMEILAEKTGSLYDPMLVKLIETYHDLVHGQKSRKSTQLTRITDLAAGMILAQDIWSRNGMKIISKGTRLSEHTLRILRQYPLDSSVESVEVQQ